MNIFSDVKSEINRYIDIEIDEDGFRVDLQDLGVKGTQYAGFEYEECATGINVEQLKQAFGADDNDALFQMLAAEYGTCDGFDLFTDFCRQNNISYDCWQG